jgi:hypothetical protein
MSEAEMKGRMGRWGRLAVPAALAGWSVITLGCASTLQVRTDYDREAAFGNLRTYAWIDSTGIVRDSAASPFLERRVRRAVDRALSERGFAAAEVESADVLVTAFVVGPTRKDTRWRHWSTAPCGPVVSFRIGIGYPFGYSLRHPRWPWWGPYFRHPWGYACTYRIGYGYIWLPVYEEPGDRLAGTLVIDMLDPGTRELIWRGSAEGAVLEYDGEAASQEELDGIAARILRDFPPGRRK